MNSNHSSWSSQISSHCTPPWGWSSVDINIPQDTVYDTSAEEEATHDPTTAANRPDI